MANICRMLSRCYRSAPISSSLLQFRAISATAPQEETLLVTSIPGSKMNMVKKVTRVSQYLSAVGFTGSVSCTAYWQLVEPCTMAQDSVAATSGFFFMAFLAVPPWTWVAIGTRTLGRIEYDHDHGIVTVSHIQCNQQRVDKSFHVNQCYFPKDKVYCHLPDGIYLFNKKRSDPEALDLLSDVACRKPESYKRNILDEHGSRLFKIALSSAIIFVICSLRTDYLSYSEKSSEK